MADTGWREIHGHPVFLGGKAGSAKANADGSVTSASGVSISQNTIQQVKSKMVQPTSSEIHAALKKTQAFKNTNIDLSKLHPKHQEEIANALHKVNEHIPHEISLHSIDMRKGESGTFAHYVKEKVAGGATRVVLNESHFGKPEKLDGALKSVQKGFLVDPTVRGVVTHEIGHALDKSRPGSAAWSIGSEARSYVKNNQPKVWDLSKYGTTNKDEAFAEAFARVIHTPGSKLTPWEKGFRDSLNVGIRKYGGKEITH